MRSQGHLWQRNNGQGNKPENFSSHSSAHHSPAESSIKEMILTECTPERAVLLKFWLADPAKKRICALGRIGSTKGLTGGVCPGKIGMA
jgi:hypothetical protein